MNTRPKLILVMGMPATGKTTLSHKIASELSLPIINRDDIKVHIMDAAGWKMGDRDWSRTMGKASYLILYYLMQRFAASRTSFVVESDFVPEFADEQLRPICEEYGYDVIQIILSAKPDIIVNRWIERASKELKHPSSSEGEQGLAELKEAIARSERQPLHLPGEVIEIDTSDLRVDGVDDTHFVAVMRRLHQILAV